MLLYLVKEFQSSTIPPNNETFLISVKLSNNMVHEFELLVAYKNE